MNEVWSAERVPPRDGRSAGEAIADVFFEVARLEREQDWSQIVQAVDRLALFTSRSNATSNRLMMVRLATVRSLLNLGRGLEAHEYLRFVENFNGRSWMSRQLLATILSYLDDYEGALAACTEALMALPLDARPSKAYRSLCVQRATALTMLGRKADARSFLLSVLQGQTPTYDDMAALRRTVDTPSALEEFFTYLTPMFTFPGHRARTALFHYSIACRDNGEPELAIAAARQRFLSGLDIVSYGGRKQPDKASWTQLAATALFDMRTDLTALGLDFFLISGTLLGCIREGNIIGHDKDIDVGVLTERSADEIRAALSTSGRFKVRPLTTDKLVQVQHANGVMIDVFLHWREDGRIYHEGQKARWWNSSFELEEVSFLGKRFLVPANAERYLEENYGPGWRTPEPDFETFVDTPNMVPQDPDHMKWYYLTKLHDYYYAGKPLQFAKVWNAVEPTIGEDGTLRTAVKQVLVQGENVLRLSENAADGDDDSDHSDADAAEGQ